MARLRFPRMAKLLLAAWPVFLLGAYEIEQGPDGPPEADQPGQSEREVMFRRYLDFASYVDGGEVQPHWLADGSSFWYVDERDDGRVLLKVDPVSNTSLPFFATDRLRAAVGQMLGHEPEGEGVPFDAFDLIENESAVVFEVEDRRFVLRLDDYSIEVDLSPEEVVTSARSLPHPIWNCCQHELQSPDGTLFAGIEDHNVYVRPASSDRNVLLTTDGSDQNFWAFWMVMGGEARWSPDGSRLAILKGDVRGATRIPIVRYDGPSDTVESVLFPYGEGPKPGREIFVIDVSSGQRVKVEIGNEILGWSPDGSEIFVRERVDEHMSSPSTILAAEPASGRTRVVLTDVVDQPVSNGFDIPEPSLTFLPASGRFIWLCDSNGWRHLCLYELSGELVSQLTGDFSLERLVAVDEERGWVYFTAHGDPDRPYDTHFYRVDLGGTRMQQLTEATGHHNIQLSPSRRFFVDSHSTLDRPPRVDLRATDGRFVMTLASARIDRLLEELDWKPPEEFVVKAADGITDLCGVLYTPFDFDPERSYPVIQRVYGSGFSIVPHEFNPPGVFGLFLTQPQALSQLGYVVMMVDARGSRWRGTAFQNVVWEKPGFYEIADYAATLKQLAESRPYMDLTRVGIIGGSYGGYLALHGILSAPEVYHVGVVTAGVSEIPRHINRVRLPAGNQQAFEYASNLRLAGNLDGKLLMIHGTGDDAVPMGHTMRMAKALIDAGKEFDLLIMPGETHATDNIWTGYGRDAWIRYFREHLDP